MSEINKFGISTFYYENFQKTKKVKAVENTNNSAITGRDYKDKNLITKVNEQTDLISETEIDLKKASELLGKIKNNINTNPDFTFNYENYKIWKNS